MTKAARLAGRRRLARRLLLGLLAALALALVGLAVLVIAARLAPDWWGEARVGDASEGEGLENAMVAEATRVRGAEEHGGGGYRSAPWAIVLTESQANAWLAHRLPRWAEARGGALAGATADLRPRVAFREGRVLIGVEPPGTGAAVAWAACEPWIDADGSVWLTSEARLGRLTLPGPLERAVLARAPASLRAALRGVGPLSPDGAIPLDDGRQVRLTGVRVLDGRLELEAVTTKPQRPAPR